MTVKKILEWYSRVGMIKMEEGTFREGRRGKKLRPFSQVAEVSYRSYSRPLQRAIVDFGADVPFHKIPFKLKEHHRIQVPISSARKITLKHGEQMGDYQEARRNREIPNRAGVPRVIAQTDGTMLPIVETDPASQSSTLGVDRRKARELKWKEARLCLAHQKGSLDVFYGATFNGVEETGQQLTDCAIRSGTGWQTKVHCVGDGAPWIANQVEDKFAAQGSYLIDFYHLCEYLHAAAKSLPGKADKWLATQKQRMKNDQSRLVLKSLDLLKENPEVPEEQAPVRACYRYLINRPGQFGYKQAIEDDLPIGSGEVESGHRHVIQDRLKRPGAWWLIQNAQSMLDLRTTRANRDWDSYWSMLPLPA